MTTPTQTSRFSVACFLAGLMTGSCATTYLLNTQSPVPIGGTAIAFAAAASPACIVSLLVGRLVPHMAFLLPPMLLMGGFAVPLDCAFACMLGWIGQPTLQGVVVCFASLAAVALAALVEPPKHLLKTLFNKRASSTIKTLDSNAPGAMNQ